MDRQTGALLFVTAGFFVVGAASVLLPPPHEETFFVHSSSTDDPPDEASIRNYSDLSGPAKSAVDDSIEQGYTTLSKTEDPTAIETLDREMFVRKSNQTYLIYMSSADGDGEFIRSVLRMLSLASGGLLIGSAVFIGSDRSLPLRSVCIPLFAVCVLFVVDALGAVTEPDNSLVGPLSFVLAAGVSLLAGVSVRRRDNRVAVISVLTLGSSIWVLQSGDSVSGLYILMALIVLGLPGSIFGWWIGAEQFGLETEAVLNPRKA